MKELFEGLLMATQIASTFMAVGTFGFWIWMLLSNFGDLSFFAWLRLGVLALAALAVVPALAINYLYEYSEFEAAAE